MLDPAGRARPVWAGLVDHVGSAPQAELLARGQAVRRLLDDHTAGYVTYEPDASPSRWWALDPIPLILDSAAWRELSQGVIQRFRLLEAAAHRIYDAGNDWLSSPFMPSDLIFGQRRYCREVRGVHPEGGRWIHLAAFDLCRQPDGRWVVVADHVEQVDGLGYVLENRLVVSRAWPGAYRDHEVRRLAPFFAAWRDALTAAAPSGVAHPRVVLLSEGAADPAFFEHNFLAHYLGVPVVESADLTTRDGRLYLKTLRGLYPVDVVLRRLDELQVDPLELGGDPGLGVAGLIGAIRRSQVAMANPPGVGVLEAPGVHALLGAWAPELLGEQLGLPGREAWWLGGCDADDPVWDRLDDLELSPAAHDAFSPLAVSIETLEDLRSVVGGARRDKARRLARGLVARAPVLASTAPIWLDGRIEPRTISLRMFVAATQDGHVVLPGGLCGARPMHDPSSGRSIDPSAGLGVKDVWVRSDGPVEAFSMLPASSDHPALVRGGYFLPSRVAEQLYWMGRYLERTELGLRLCRFLMEHQSDQEPSDRDTLDVRAVESLTCRLFLGGDSGSGETMDQRLRRILVDAAPPTTLSALLAQIHKLATRVRDRFATDTWRILADLHRELAQVARADVDVLTGLNRMLTSLAALSGMAMEGMTRAHGWRFLDLGRRIERASLLERQLAAWLADEPVPTPGRLAAVLEINASLMTYRSRYQARTLSGPVVDLLVIDETNPRSLAFQCEAILQHVRKLPDQRAESVAELPIEERIALELATRLRLADAYDLTAPDDTGMPALRALLAQVADCLPRIDHAVSLRYISHGGGPEGGGPRFGETS